MTVSVTALLQASSMRAFQVSLSCGWTPAVVALTPAFMASLMGVRLSPVGHAARKLSCSFSGWSSGAAAVLAFRMAARATSSATFSILVVISVLSSFFLVRCYFPAFSRSSVSAFLGCFLPVELCAVRGHCLAVALIRLSVQELVEIVRNSNFCAKPMGRTVFIVASVLSWWPPGLLPRSGPA